jgi:hypothetical protein
MQSCSARRGSAFVCCVLILGFFGVATISFAQPGQPAESVNASPALIDLRQGRQAITVVSTQWKFHPGNDLQWANPTFNDHDWKLLNVSDDWDKQGYHEEQDQAWFRFAILVPANTPGLVIEMPKIHKNYQLFADSKLVGQVGSLPPEKSYSTKGAARVFTLPVTPSDKPQRMTLALRLWQSQAFKWAERDGFGEVLIGEPDVLLAEFEQSKAADLVLAQGMDSTTFIFSIPVTIAALLLFWLTRKSLYLWFAGDMLMGYAQFTSNLLAGQHAWRSDVTLGILVATDILAAFANIMFIMGLLGLRRSRWMNAAIACVTVAELSTQLVAFRLPFVWADGLFFTFTFASQLIPAWLMFRAWRKGGTDTGIFLVPFAFNLLVAASLNFGYTLMDAGVAPGVFLGFPNFLILDKPFPVNIVSTANLLLMFGYLAVMVYHFVRMSSEEQRLTTALQAAREIQYSLVPARQSVHGSLQADIAYLAAEEVGGDFCQILPRTDGSVLVVVGDVAGKGLKAAMVGAIAVGALRTMTEEQVTPSILLGRMNDLMVRNDERVFITCLCLEIDPDGTMTIANAGHLSPYLNGVEMECDSGLPLGLISGFPYGETRASLPDRARITLMSDGVVEARSRSGELFGFDRTLGISRQSASQIAAAAEQFGQEDDITVVTLDWMALPVSAA